jgi:leucyl-tRNA synthetase
MGFDSFGLPTENYAVKTGIHPQKVTDDNIANFTRQLKMLGFSFDWSRQVTTSEADYYKWTQWIFLKLFKKGLAYQDEIPVNWCPALGTILANEEVVDGKSEVGNHPVYKKPMRQWLLRITAYAQRLIDDLGEVDFLDKIKAQQTNWIGRSEGADMTFSIARSDETITVYTTRPDTVFGATYMVLSPEHALLDKLKPSIQNWDEVEKYRRETSLKSDLERTELSDEKTGVKLSGVEAVNPATGKNIPVFIADYVLSTYGTGSIMAVPGHDQRDWDFAKAFSLPVIEVIAGGDVTKEAFTSTSEGTLINSGFLNGMEVKDAIEKMCGWLEEKGIGHAKVNYKLRDWTFSRQRYWGEPIPVYYNITPAEGVDSATFNPRNGDACTVDYSHAMTVDESELPLKLPEIEYFQPTEEGDPPLARCLDWMYFQKDGKWFARETNTMPQWAGSSWYFLRYIDPHNDDMMAAREKLDYWMPVDWYNGGMEHTTLHLLYSRFWHKFLYDEGLVSTSEPYAKRTSHGMVLAEDNQKMSKSRGNVVNPDDVVLEYGADALRVFEMFMGAFEQTTPWSTRGVNGVHKFLNRIWVMSEKVSAQTKMTKKDEYELHTTIQAVGERIESMKFNTAISAMMTLVNYLSDKESVNKDMFETLLILLSPFAPHICCEIWENLGNRDELTLRQWPSFDEAKTVADTVTLAIQIMGKLRHTMEIPLEIEKDELATLVKAEPQVLKYLDGKTIVKEIYVPGRIYNIVVR